MLPRLLIDFPPCLARLLARIDGKPPTSQCIARASDISRDRVDAISYSVSWDGYRNKETWAFLVACGITEKNARRHREFIRRNNWGHLNKRPNKKRYFARLMHLWLTSLQ